MLGIIMKVAKTKPENIILPPFPTLTPAAVLISLLQKKAL